MGELSPFDPEKIYQYNLYMPFLGQWMYQALFGPADMMGLQRSYTLPFGKGTSVHQNNLSSMEISVTRKAREKKAIQV